MSVQVLVATMNQTDYSLLEAMNIQTEAIVANQTSFDSIEHFKYKGRDITYLNFNEIGVGLNRNNALMRASSEICVFADDDLVYFDNYEELIINEFKHAPKADVIIFNLDDPSDSRYKEDQLKRVHFYNFLRYGTARIAFRLSSVRENQIYFNQLFGGGTERSHGEDNIFLCDCLKKGLKVYSSPITIAKIKDDRPSTWNAGYNDKYLKDQRILYNHISKRFAFLLCLQDAVRHHKDYGKTIIRTLLTMYGY